MSSNGRQLEGGATPTLDTEAGAPELAAIRVRELISRLAEPFTVTVDGPAASGKDSACRALARYYGVPHLSSGALYRSLTILSKRCRVSADDGPALAALAEKLQSRLLIEYDPGNPTEQRFYLRHANGRGKLDITERLHSEEVSALTPRIARHAEVRDAMLPMLRHFGERGGVFDGRDMGSVVFPDARFKFYLDASLEERARRRLEQYDNLSPDGIVDLACASFDAAELRAAMEELHRRDEQDRSRAHGPLVVPQGATVIDNTAISEQETFLLISRAIDRQLIALASQADAVRAAS